MADFIEQLGDNVNVGMVFDHLALGVDNYIHDLEGQAEAGETSLVIPGTSLEVEEKIMEDGEWYTARLVGVRERGFHPLIETKRYHQPVAAWPSFEAELEPSQTIGQTQRRLAVCAFRGYEDHADFSMTQLDDRSIKLRLASYGFLRAVFKPNTVPSGVSILEVDEPVKQMKAVDKERLAFITQGILDAKDAVKLIAQGHAPDKVFAVQGRLLLPPVR